MTVGGKLLSGRVHRSIIPKKLLRSHPAPVLALVGRAWVFPLPLPLPRQTSSWSLLSSSRSSPPLSQIRPAAQLGISVRFFENDSEFHDVADASLEHIAEVIDIIIEDHDIENVDCDLSDGVLNIAFPTGTWVLNKQAPNMQIWWSSPISGPKRYERVGESWVSTRDGRTLSEILREEMSAVLRLSAGGMDASLSPDELPFNETEL
eukprot:CAMPEP_0194335576 /NCGR_PEP_ID=MMETSP0171-20130528/70046_1 /TAXON_ID=218684 /ORGANISM="Corethron pennatum, Strain L29A3" /LENGTH=205 /DNA_ID=CAMNT_0039098725 /DNA_START=41 /DNA_END=658 /DNA_ORIENTATION=+